MSCSGWCNERVCLPQKAWNRALTIQTLEHGDQEMIRRKMVSLHPVLKEKKQWLKVTALRQYRLLASRFTFIFKQLTFVFENDIWILSCHLILYITLGKIWCWKGSVIPSPLSQACGKLMVWPNYKNSSGFSVQHCWNTVFLNKVMVWRLEHEETGTRRYRRTEEQVKMFSSYKNSHWCLTSVHLWKIKLAPLWHIFVSPGTMHVLESAINIPAGNSFTVGF